MINTQYYGYKSIFHNTIVIERLTMNTWTRFCINIYLWIFRVKYTSDYL